MKELFSWDCETKLHYEASYETDSNKAIKSLFLASVSQPRIRGRTWLSPRNLQVPVR